jgi:nucleoside-diphosphate-sugar epimerase
MSPAYGPHAYRDRARKSVHILTRATLRPMVRREWRPDAVDRAQAARAAAGASVVYHCVSPPYTQWPELFPALTGSILGAAEASGAKLVFADNLYAYGPVDGHCARTCPRLRVARRAGSALKWPPSCSLRTARAGRWVVIGRASDYYGPHGTGSTAGQTVFGRILAGKKPQWTGRLDQPHTFHYLPDIARGLLVLAGRREADGQVWHLPAAAPLTAQQLFDLIATTAGQPVPARASIASPALLAAAGLFSPLLREMRETTYQFRAPFVIDASKFQAAFGDLEATPHHDAVQRTVAWYRSP